MSGTRLPPGFRFHPTDVELIMYYLKRKVLGKRLHVDAIAEVNLYNFSPWDLPDKSSLRNKDLEWFFFCPRERKYSSGARVKRATENGYWKTTGKDRPIVYNDRNVGSVKTLVFHLGHAPKGDRTDWVIHEYKIIDEELLATGLQDSYVLCKVFKKSGLGPKNGAQYGAPFNEADWEDDEVDACLPTMFTAVDPPLISLVSESQKSCVRGLFGPEGAPEQTLIGAGPKETHDPTATNLDAIENTSGVSLIGQGPSVIAGPATNDGFFDMSEDEVYQLFSAFTDDNALLSDQNGNLMEEHNAGENISEPCLDMDDVFSGLGDLEDNVYPQDHLLLPDNIGYIELNDLLTPLDYTSEVTGIDQLNDIFGSSNKEDMQQSYFASSSAVINRYGYWDSQLPVLPIGPNIDGSNLNVLHMPSEYYNGHIGQYDSELTQSQPLNSKNRRQHIYQGSKRGRYDHV